MVQLNQKMNKFQERLDTRILELEEIYENQPNLLIDKQEVDLDIQQMKIFWDKIVQDVVVERVKDNDQELHEIQKIWQVEVQKNKNPTQVRDLKRVVRQA